MSVPPVEQSEDQLRAAWAAIADRDRRGDELLRRRLQEVEERLSRLDVGERELAVRANDLDRREREAAEERRSLRDRAEEAARSWSSLCSTGGTCMVPYSPG